MEKNFRARNKPVFPATNPDGTYKDDNKYFAVSNTGITGFTKREYAAFILMSGYLAGDKFRLQFPCRHIATEVLGYVDAMFDALEEKES